MTMKKIKTMILFVMLLFTGVLTSCTLETSDNGDFDGYWHLLSAENLKDGTITDYSQRRVFWGVQAKLIHLTDFDYDVESYYLRFNRADGVLSITEAYIDHWHQDNGDDGGDIAVSDTAALSHFMIMRLPEEYKVESLNGSKMILCSDTYRLKFRKQ